MKNTTELQARPAGELALLITLAALQFTHIMDFMIMMPLGPQLMRIFHINPQEFGFLVSAYTFSAGIVGFLSSFYLDRFDRKEALRVLYIGFLLGTMACALAPDYWFLLAARMLTGAFGGILGSLCFAIVSDAIPYQRRGAAMGIVMMGFSLASVLGVPFGLYLATLYSWHAPFWFLIIAGSVETVLISRFIPNLKGHLKAGDPPKPLALLKDTFKESSPRYALLLIVLVMFGQFSVIPFLSPTMVSNVGFTELQLTYIYLVGGGVTLFTGPIVGRLADRFGKATIFRIFACLSLIPLYLITHLGVTPIIWVLVMTTSFFIFANGRMIPLTALITSTVPPERRGAFMGIQSCVQQLAAGASAIVAGYIVSRDATGHIINFPYVGYLAMCMTLLCIAMVTKVKTKETQPAQI